MARIMINTTMLKKFRGDFNEAVKELEKKYEVSINIGSISYDESHFSSKLEVKVAGEAGEQANKKEFETYAKLFGFDPTDYNREFMLQGKKFKLVGFNPRCPKNSCSIEEVSSGKKYKCSEKAVKF